MLTFDFERTPPFASIQMYLGLLLDLTIQRGFCMHLLGHSTSLLVELHVFHELEERSQQICGGIGSAFGRLTFSA